jgi:hypothetical protein
VIVEVAKQSAEARHCEGDKTPWDRVKEVIDSTTGVVDGVTRVTDTLDHLQRGHTNIFEYR